MRLHLRHTVTLGAVTVGLSLLLSGSAHGVALGLPIDGAVPEVTAPVETVVTPVEQTLTGGALAPVVEPVVQAVGAVAAPDADVVGTLYQAAPAGDYLTDTVAPADAVLPPATALEPGSADDSSLLAVDRYLGRDRSAAAAVVRPFSSLVSPDRSHPAFPAAPLSALAAAAAVLLVPVTLAASDNRSLRRPPAFGWLAMIRNRGAPLFGLLMSLLLLLVSNFLTMLRRCRFAHAARSDVLAVPYVLGLRRPGFGWVPHPPPEPGFCVL
ncbi:hypothetical protein KY386_03150 [Candidatus Parcubacteria bacterium]|nr:hypothetical protein [Candidatus Parcubacteria bacterium]